MRRGGGEARSTGPFARGTSTKKSRLGILFDDCKEGVGKERRLRRNRRKKNKDGNKR